MKQVIKKYTQIITALDDLSDIDDITRANIKRCVAIYINGEILRAFNRYVQQPGMVVTADVIAFFYLHLQMSGAANESLSRNFTASCPGLSRVLFDDTPDGNGAARLPRFAGAHATSLTTLLQSFSPGLLSDYIRALDEILPIIKTAILKHALSLDSILSKKVKIEFSPMPAVDFVSSKFMVGAQQEDARCLLESIKAIDILAHILSEEQQNSFCDSVPGQALAIMARQVVANNINKLVKGKVLSPSVDFAELRHFRNYSAHGYVIWEIQNNAMYLWFNCVRLMLGAKDILITQLQNKYHNVMDNYLNPPSLETKAREEESSLLTPCVEPTRVKKKHKKPAQDKALSGQKVNNAEYLAKKEQQVSMSLNLLSYMLGFIKGPDLSRDLMTKLKRVSHLLDCIYQVNPGFPIHDINEPLIARAKGRIKKNADLSAISWNTRVERGAERGCYISCPMEIKAGSQTLGELEYTVFEKMYPKGIKELKYYPLGILFSIFCNDVGLLSSQENLELFKAVLNKFLDYGASPNATLQTDAGVSDILSFAIEKKFPTEVITILLERDANIHQIVGNRPYINSLTYAARSRPDVMLLLLLAGANPLEIIFDPFTVPLTKSSLFCDLIMTMDDPIDSRMASLRILYPYVFQKYGEEALLTNMQVPIKSFVGGRKIKESQMPEVLIFAMALPTREQLKNASGALGTQFTREDIMPALLLHNKVQTVLTDPKFSFYKLVLHDEIGVIMQEIKKLGSPQAVLAAMGVNNGMNFTALDFAKELGLTKVYKCLKQEHDRCLGIKPVAPAIESKAEALVAQVSTSQVTTISCTTALSCQQANWLGNNSGKAVLVGIVTACTAMLYLASNCIETGFSR